MPNVVLQPASGPEARAHYVATIENPVPLEEFVSFLADEDLSHLRMLYGDRPVPTWGVTPAVNGQNVGRWERLVPGDVVLFAWDLHVRASAVVTHKVHNAALAEELWNKNKKGQVWEYMYFLDSVLPRNIPYEELNRVIPYADSNIIQGFGVLDEEQSANVLAAFDFGSAQMDLHAAPPEIRDLREAAGESGGPAGRRRTRVPYEVLKAIEDHAMARAEEHFTSEGWAWEDVSPLRFGYDLLCRRDGDELYVEVKGTVSDGAQVPLTGNEVRYAEEHHLGACLLVVSGIKVETTEDGPKCSGGNSRLLLPWDIKQGKLKALTYTYQLPQVDGDLT